MYISKKCKLDKKERMQIKNFPIIIDTEYGGEKSPPPKVYVKSWDEFKKIVSDIARDKNNCNKFVI